MFPYLITFYVTICSERLEKATNQSSLSQLSSLTLVLPKCATMTGERHALDRAVYQAIHCATRILERIERAHLRDVRIIFQVAPIGRLGFCLSPAGTSREREACTALEDALLAFPLCCVLVLQGFRISRRAGRVEFWAPTIKRAFPKLTERGLLMFPSSKFIFLRPAQAATYTWHQLTTIVFQPGQMRQNPRATSVMWSA